MIIMIEFTSAIVSGERCEKVGESSKLSRFGLIIDAFLSFLINSGGCNSANTVFFKLLISTYI